MLNILENAKQIKDAKNSGHYICRASHLKNVKTKFIVIITHLINNQTFHLLKIDKFIVPSCFNARISLFLLNY